MMASEAVEAYGGVTAAAQALGVHRTTVQRRLRSEARRPPPPGISEFPQIPDEKEPIDTLLQRRLETFQRKKVHADAKRWQQIRMSDDMPIGLVLIGDPHLDDDGCDWPQLSADIALMRETEGLFGINIGDSSNNWVGRLARLFGNQETSQTSARQLVEWFLTDAGIRWLAVLLGNHDLWNEGGEILKRMAAGAEYEIPVHHWAALLELAFPNGSRCRLKLAHDFKGRSIYSTTHGPLRESIWSQGDDADVYAAGHIHFGGTQQVELPGGRTPWLVRVKGYKCHDHYALEGGYHEGTRFASVVVIIDPRAPREDRVMVFGSVAAGAAVLKAMRATCNDNRRTLKFDATGPKGFSATHTAPLPQKPVENALKGRKRQSPKQSRKRKAKRRDNRSVRARR